MNKKRFLHTLFSLAFLMIAGWFVNSSAFAQLDRTVDLTLPELDRYPEITFYLDPRDRNGSPLLGLTEDLITLQEDDLQRNLTEFQELQPGIQLVVAFNVSSPFAIQDINGNSRFDFIKETLLNWVSQPLDSSPDDLSIVTNSGLEAVHLTDRNEWAAALEEYDPPLRESQSDFNVLSRAIEIASDSVDQPGMKKVVLLFSVQPSSDSYSSLESLSSQAQDNQVLLYNILVSSPAFFDTEGASRLEDLSRQTGGQYLTYSGEEPFADPGQLLKPLRSTYLVRYQSSIVSSGTHTLEVSITSSPSDIVGQREFNLEIQPPNPIFISPPRTITRSVEDSGEQEQIQDIVNFQPDSYPLSVLVEFPDDHPRDLEELIFRVDDKVAGRLTSPPFDRVIWDLDEYQNSAVHYLTLEAVDSMGLSRVSLPTPIEIVIEQPPQSLTMIIRRNLPAFTGLGFILLLGIFLFLLIARGAIRPGNPQGIPWIVTQGRRTATFFRKMMSPNISKFNAEVETANLPYRLIPINSTSQQLSPEPITISLPEIILGSHKGEGKITIEHPSIIPEHTRIKALEDDRYQITDLGGASGTWVNHQQITGSKSYIIRDGDIIQIGEAAFRFQVIPRIQTPLQNEEKSP